MTTLNPLDHEEVYNAIYLGNRRSPGVVTLSGHDRKVTWDVKAGPGLNGATTTLKEVPLLEITASFYLVRDDGAGIDQWTEWEEFLPIIESTVNGSKPKALDIYHPDLASQTPPIKSVCKASVGGAVHDGKGGITVTVRFQEYRAPKKLKAATPVGSKAKPKADPDAAALAEIDRLTKQYQATPWG